MINLTINNKSITVAEGVTIIEAARINSIYIPNLCYLKDVHKYGTCRICSVEVEGMRNLQASCMVEAKDGMVVHTNSKRVRDARKMLYQLLLSNHPRDCLSCQRNQSCELQELGYTLGVTDCGIGGVISKSGVDVSPSVTRDFAKCILCRRCVTVCKEIQTVSAIEGQSRGFDTVISPSMELPLGEVNCAMCGQCTVVCPTGALRETDALEPVWSALQDESKRVVVQVAPAVRAALGEEFGMQPGTLVTGKMASVLRELGFDDVFDTNFAADLTIIEEGTELLGRLSSALKGGGEGAVLPMITSCSPGWIKYCENFYPDELGHLSTCKSPHTMFGAVVKSFYADRLEIAPENMFVVSVMPCTAKKYEIQRPEMQNGENFNVDAVLTTRELARMIKSAGIDFCTLSDSEFDRPLGFSTGAADIFGVTGGVMEAALRTVYEIVTDRSLPFDNLHVAPIVGLDQVKTAEVKFEGTLPEYAFLEGVTAKIAVTSGLEGAGILMDQIREGTSPYHFIEVMGCPGGCINGGGQPRSRDEDYRTKRMQALYREDEGKPLRKSHENPDIAELYGTFLGEANGHLAHELLHTHYVPRGKYNELVDCIQS